MCGRFAGVWQLVSATSLLDDAVIVGRRPLLLVRVVVLLLDVAELVHVLKLVSSLAISSKIFVIATIFFILLWIYVFAPVKYFLLLLSELKGFSVKSAVLQGLQLRSALQEVRPMLPRPKSSLVSESLLVFGLHRSVDL